MTRFAPGPARVLALSVVTALVVAACSAKRPASPSATGGRLVIDGTVTIGLSGDPGSLDPQLSVTPAAAQLTLFGYDPLVHLAQDGTIASGLAASWTTSGATTTFTLHKGITCSDGTPFTARDVVANVSFVADPANQSPYLGTFLPPGTAATASSDDTVALTTKDPAPFLLQGLAGLPLVCKAGLAQRASLQQRTAGTGPYVLTRAAPNDKYIYRRRDGYTWGPGGQSTTVAGLPKSVVFQIEQNPTTVANLLLGGQLQAAQVTGPDQSRLSRVGLFRTTQRQGFGALWFNHAAGHATSDATVRKALVQAVDLAELRTVATGGLGVAPRSLVAADPPACDDDNVTGHVPPHDPAAAKAGLAAAKSALRLIYPTSLGSDLSSAVELATQEWAEAGVTVKAVGKTDADFQSTVFGSGSWDIAMVPTGSGVQNPSQLVPLLSGPPPPAGLNIAHIENGLYEQASAKAVTKRGADGCPDWDRAEKALLDAVNVAPFADNQAVFFGSGARFSLTQTAIDPASLRQLAS